MSMDRVNSREMEKISVAKRQEDEKNATVDNTFADQGTRLPWRQDNSNGVRPTIAGSGEPDAAVCEREWAAPLQ
jgi:hypothetical protein